MFEGIRDDRYLERVLHRVTYGQAHPVDGYRAFVYGKVSAFRYFGLEIILEREIPASVGIVNSRAYSCLVYMSLHDMSVQPAVHQHAPFYVHFIAFFQQPDIRAFDGFFHGGNGVRIVFDVNHGEAHTVVRHALVYFQFIYKRTRQGQMQVFLFFDYLDYFGTFFYYS